MNSFFIDNKNGTHKRRFVWLLASAPDQVSNTIVVPFTFYLIYLFLSNVSRETFLYKHQREEMQDRKERHYLHDEIVFLDPDALKQIEGSREKQKEQCS